MNFRRTGLLRRSLFLVFPELFAELIDRHRVIRAVVVTGYDVEVIEPEPILRAVAVFESQRDGAEYCARDATALANSDTLHAPERRGSQLRR